MRIVRGGSAHALCWELLEERVLWQMRTLRKVDIRLPEKGNSHSHGVRLVH